MESQFGIAHVWTQGDFVTRAVAIILLAMSVASWLVIVIKALDIVKFKKYAKTAQDFWHSADLATGLEKLGDDKQNPSASWCSKAAKPLPTTARPAPTCMTPWTSATG